MSKFLNLAKDTFNSKKLKIIKSERNFKTFRFLSILSVIILVIFNIVKINCNTTKGYEISKFQDKLAKLEEGRKTLNLEIADLKSLQSIEERLKKMDLIQNNEITYLAGNEKVAVARR